MDRVHSQCVHSHKNGIIDSVYLGNGGMAGMCILLALVNYKLLFDPTLQRLLHTVWKILCEEINTRYILMLLFANTARWIAAYYYVGHFSRVFLSGLISIAVVLEVVLYMYTMNGFSGIILRYFSAIQMMKMISYVLSTRESALLGKDDTKIEEPVCTPSLLRFIVYPTLCYQTKYPFGPISYFNALMYAGMFLPLCVLFYWTSRVMCMDACYRMWHIPSADAYIDVVLWSNAAWFCGFLLVFVVIFGFQSEITEFGDKKFFGAWWDSTISGYWRRWNTMVHTWIKRHVHKALLKKNMTPRTSKAVIFLVSGLVHEYIIGNSIGRRGIGFLTMAIQIPLDTVVRAIEHSTNICPQFSSLIIFNILGAPFIAMLATSTHHK
ncbi:diacylglycerol O-acyltransferase 1 [Nematocida sp. AWRm77]|nr:diacylglycerol O-acyltransferase 1 [Nematocida sp. AWRm77]